MKWKPKRGYRRALLLTVLVVAAVALFLRSRWAWDGSCTLARRVLPAVLGMEVGIGRCELDPVSQTVRLYGLSIRPHGADEPLLAADRAEVSGLSVLPFIGVRVGAVRITRPRLSLDLSRPPGAVGKSSECSLDALRAFDLGSLDVRGAEVRIRAPDGRAVELTGVDMGWTSRRGIAAFQLDAARGFVRSSRDGEVLSVTALSVAGEWSPRDDRVDLRKGELGLDEATLALSGSVEDLCAPRFNLEAQLFLPLQALARATRAPPETAAAGHLWSRLALTGSAEAPVLSAEVISQKARWARFAPGDFNAQLRWVGDDLAIHALRFSAGPGRVSVSGNLKLTPRLPARFRLETEGAHLAKVLERVGMPGAWVDFPATVRAQISGTLLPAPEIKGEAEFTTGRFHLATRAFDQPQAPGVNVLDFDAGEGRTGIRILPDRVELHDIKVKVGESRAEGEVNLFYASESGIRVRAQADLNLSDFRHIAEIPWSGHGPARVDIHGPYGTPQIDATVSFRDFRFWYFDLGLVEGPLRYHASVLSFPGFTAIKGKTPYAAQGALTFSEPGLHIRGGVDAPRGRAEDLLDLISPLHPSVEVFQGAIEGPASAQVRIDSLAEKLSGQIRIAFKDTRYYGRRMGDGEVALRFLDGDALELSHARWDGPAGRFRAEGRYDFSGPLDYRFEGSELSASEWAGAGGQRMGLEGVLDLQGTVSGTDAVPVVRARLTSPRVAMNGQTLGPLRLNAALDGLDFTLRGLLFEGAELAAGLKLKAPYPYGADVTFGLAPVRPLLPRGAVSQGVSGTLTGTAHAEGNLGGTARPTVKARIAQVTLSRGDFGVANQAPVAAYYENGKLGVETFTLRGPNTELTAEGWLGESRLDVKAQGSMDVRLLESFAPDLENTAGRLQLGVSARGAREAPLLVGTAELRDARFSLRDRQIAVRGLSGKVEFSETRVLVQDVGGQLNDGRFTVGGDVELDRFKPRRVQLSARLDDVSFRPAEDLPVRMGGELLLHGRPQAMVLSGDLNLLKLRYERPFVLDDVAGGLKREGGGGGDRPSEWLSFDVRFHTRGDVRVDNNLANARLVGDVTLTGTNLNPGLLGRIEAAGGSQAYFRGNQFRVSQGVLEFRERHRVDAVMDVQAETQVREYLVRLHAFGRTRQPSIILSSEPALSEADILSLLTVGVTSRDRSNTAGTGAAIATEAFLNASGLDRQLQRFIPKNALLRDVSFHISSAYNDITGSVEPTAQLESKFLTEQLKLGMSQPVSISGRGTRARAEYQFDPRLSAQAQWDNEHSDSAFGNLGLDLKLRWETE